MINPFCYFYINKTVEPRIMIMIAMILGHKVCAFIFSFIICGKNFVAKRVRKRTMAG